MTFRVSRNSRALNRWHAVAVLSLTAACLATSSPAVTAQSSEDAHQTGLVGTWAVQVTLRDCETNAALGPPFNSLATFHRGGTESGSSASQAFAPGQRTSEHGTWSHQGRRTYVQDFMALIVFDSPSNLPGTPAFDPSLPASPGFFTGWQTVAHTVDLIDHNRYTSAGTNAFYKADGTLYRSGCSTAVAQRFE
jgi:hypothetical protein